MALHVFTQEEFDAIPRDKYGWKNCPSGDYTQIKNFPERCSFERGSIFGSDAVFENECRLGDGCQLGNRCQLGNICRLGDDCQLGNYCDLGDYCRFGAGAVFENGLVQGTVSMLRVAYIGSRKGTTYFWKHNKGIFVRCGCFSGDIEKFKAQVEETHKNNPQHLKEYRGAIQYAKTVFGVEETQ